MQQPTAAAPVQDITLAGAPTPMSAVDKLKARTRAVKQAQTMTPAGGSGPRPGDVDDALDHGLLDAMDGSALARAVAKEPAPTPAEKLAQFWRDEAAKVGDDPWALATRKITAALAGEPRWAGSSNLPLPEENWDGGLGEAWGRELAEEGNRDIQFLLPMIWVMTCTAGEGAFHIDLPDPGVTVPLIIQAVGVAPTGQGKSSLLKRLKPTLEKALITGLEARRAWISEQAAKYVGGVVGNPEKADAADALLKAALCPVTLTDGGTPQGTRDNLAANGFHRAVITDEDDMLRELSAFSNDSGTVTVLIKGWDREGYVVDRAAARSAPGRPRVPDDISLTEPSLPIGMILQEEAFIDKTDKDHFDSKGILSRWLMLVGSERPIPDHYELPSAAAAQEAGADTSRGVKAGQAWSALSKRGAGYRAAKAVVRAVRVAQSAGGETGGLEEIDPGPGVKLEWTDEALDAHRRVQQMRNDVRRALRERGLGDEASLYAFAERLTQHVERIALARTLLDDPQATVISARMISDTATRYMPWLTSHWIQVYRRRREEVGADAINEMFKYNRDLHDRTISTAVLGVMLRRTTLGSGDDIEIVGYMSRKSLLDGVKGLGGRRNEDRNKARSLAASELPRLVKQNFLREIEGDLITTGPKKGQRKEMRYQLTMLGAVHVQSVSGLSGG